MAKYEFTGTVSEIRPVRTYGQRGIQVREFRCKEPPYGPNAKWENVLPFVINYDPSGDKYNNLSQLDDVHVGDKIRFSFVMRGREWKNPSNGETRVFVDNKVCSKIEVLERSETSRQGDSRGAAPEESETEGYESEDTMPF